MGQNEAKYQYQPVDGIHFGVIVQGKEACQHSREKGHDEDGGAGGDEPLGDDIQTVPFFLRYLRDYL